MPQNSLEEYMYDIQTINEATQEMIKALVDGGVPESAVVMELFISIGSLLSAKNPEYFATGLNLIEGRKRNILKATETAKESENDE